VTELTVRQAGQRGGQATSAKYGHAHFAAIGAMAGRPASAVARARARTGGLATRASHDRAHFQAIGRTGGESLLAHRGTEWFSEIGRLGALAKAARRRAQEGLT